MYFYGLIPFIINCRRVREQKKKKIAEALHRENIIVAAVPNTFPLGRSLRAPQPHQETFTRREKIYLKKKKN